MRASRAVVAGVVAVVVLAVLPIAAVAAPYAATATITPSTVAQGAPTTFTVTVNNTGTSTTIGAVEIRRPDSKWLVNTCLTRPTGWSLMTASDTMCRFKSASGTSDDIAVGGSAQFTFTATPTATGTNYSGQFKVTVSNMNMFAKPARLVTARGPLTVSTTGDAAPSVTSTSPADAATGVLVGSNIVINFSETIHSSIQPFTLECPTSTPISAVASGAPGTSIIIDPTTDLPAGTICTVTIRAADISDTDVVDPPDNMAADYVFSFTTADTAPSVTSTSPANGTTTNVAPNTSIVVNFTEPVNAVTFSFTLKCPAGSPNQPFGVTGSPGSAITIDPVSDLPEGTACAVRVIASQIHDTDAVDPPDTMVADYNFSFTTGVGQAPTDMQLSANSIAQNQPIGTDIGTLTTTDADSLDSNVYTLENTGCGGGPFPDNSSFQIGGLSGDVLQSAAIFDYATKSSYTVCIRATDSGTLSFDKQFTISIAPPNTAPVLNASKTPTASAEDEDAPIPVGAVGTPVSTLVDLVSVPGGLDNVTDPDAGAVAGIAVTADQTFIPVSGTWYYTTDGGTNWTVFPSISASTALLLAADVSTAVYFKPAANFNGTLTTGLTFRAWDQTSGSNGGTADTTTNGGTTAFSTGSDTASITVNAVNDAPTGVTDAAQTVGNVELFYDVATGGAPGTTKTTVSGKGVLDNDFDVDGNNISVSGIVGCVDVTAPFDCSTTGGGTISMDAAGHFTYRPVAGSTSADSFQYTVTDDAASPLSSNVTVNLTFVGNRIWFVKNDTTAGGTGRSWDPFDTLAEAQTAANAANDVVFVYYGDGTTTGQASGFTMQAAGQRLQGQAVGLTTGTTVNGVSSGTLVAAGSRPLIDDTAGNGVDMSVGSTVTGLSVKGQGDAIVFGTNGVSSGNYVIDNNVIRGAGGIGIHIVLDTSATGTANVKVLNNSFNLVLPILGTAIYGEARGSSTLTMLIQGNSIVADATFGIFIAAAQGPATVNATIVGNNINLTSASDLNAISVQSAALITDLSTVCAQIGGATLALQNTLASAGPDPELRLRQIGTGSVFRLPGYVGSGTDDAAVANFVLGQNGSNGATGLASHVSTTGFSGGSACPTPP